MRTGSRLRFLRALTLWTFCTWEVAVEAADLRVMKTGLGNGTVSAPGMISCGTGGTDCNETGLSGSVTLSVTVPLGSRFRAWGGDCASVVVTPPATPSCTVSMTTLRSVRADFELITPIARITDFSPAGLETYLNANPNVDTPAELVAALPQDFRENWLLMPRSESLQTGTAKFPRILLVSADATRVFTIALDTHSSYPGAHPSAIEYMQWNAADNNFHFHEIVLRDIPNMDQIDPGPPAVFRFPERLRGTDPVREDDPKCFSCHSTRNVKHDGGSTPGTTGTPIGSVPWKNKPNWDTYDSWGGMLAFNRDRIYQGTVEAAAFRRIFNLWTWQDNDAVRAVIEQLKLQPDGVPASDRIIRWDTPPLAGGANDGHIEFAFDPDFVPPQAVTQEPQPTGTGPNVLYNFDRRVGPANPTDVLRSDVFVRLHHSCQPGSDEGRAVELFDRLTGGRPRSDPTTSGNEACQPRPLVPLAGPNALRIADELITHRYATGNVRVDVRPIALAIARGCIGVVGGTDITATQTVTGLPAGVLAFFEARNGLTFDQVYDDTRRRAQSLTRRKADIARTTFDRDTDPYVFDPNPFDATPIADTSDLVKGMIREFGAFTLGIPGGTAPVGSTFVGEDRSLQRLRQEVFRRAPPPGHADDTVMGGFYVDREDDSTPLPSGFATPDNTAAVALYRFLLEPLGVSVDKWSMGVRGRSRTYTFADVFGAYTGTFQTELATSLGLPATATCTADIDPLVTAALGSVATFPETPTYTDIQRVFNKSCIECHDASVGYPPYRTYALSGLDLSENENPPAGERRLWRSLSFARTIIGAPACPPGTPVCAVGTGTDVTNSYLYQRITDGGLLQHPYNPGQPHNFSNPDDPANPDVADERCPNGLMPCEGPPLSKVDIESFRRWIIGGRPNTEGDPHIRTIDGVHYDFQSAGEFILLRGEGLELQARQTAVTTAAPVGPDRHTGLTSCVSVNTAIAMRAGLDRITYQPTIDVRARDGAAAAKERRLILRVNGKEVQLGAGGIALPSGGRIISTTVAGGIEVFLPGGEAVVVTPRFWEYYQIWYMNLEVRHARSTEGVMGAIAPGSWLPALSTGQSLGRIPSGLAQRFRDLYDTFASSWRVDTQTSLFDYEAGLSPASFVVQGWPVATAQGCVAPPQPGGPLARPAPAPIARAEAERLCRAIVDAARRRNCVADVMATGEAGFAATYKDTEALERRLMPAPAVLVSPADNARVKANRIDFAWRPHRGTEGIDVVYRHCIWSADEVFDFNRCIKLAPGSDTPLGSLAFQVQKRLWLAILIVILLLLVIAVLLILRYRKRGLVVALFLALVVAALLFALVRVRVHGPLETSVTGLVPGKVYFWKVVAETPDGVTVESQTYRLEVAP